MDQETNSENSEVSTTSPKIDTRSYQMFVGIAFIIAIVVGAMYYFGPILGAPKPVSSTTPAAITQVSPDTVLATVNGEEIIQATIDERLQGAGQALAAQGVDINDPQVRLEISLQILDDTINYTLLKQGAAKAGITDDTKAIEESFQTFVTQVGDEETLIAQLEQAGMTVAIFKERLAEQIRIDSYIGANVAVDAIEVTDKEISDFYNSATAAAADDTPPPLADVKEQISTQLAQQKQQELIATFTTTLRESATVEIN